MVSGEKVQPLLFVLVGIILCGNYVESRRGYVLTFPQQLQAGAKETFCLSLFNVTNDITLHLNISCYGRMVEHKSDIYRNGKPGCFVWELPQTLPAGMCEFEVEGGDEEGQLRFNEKQDLEVVDNYQTTFIQTDRHVYKPGHTVQFRILTITQALLPVLTNIDSVIIQDPHDFYMKRWTELPVKAGLVSLDYKLYDEPVLGDWKIVSIVNGRKTEQKFSVDKYVLPKFEVTMKLPAGLTVSTKQLHFEVCARYTFGKRVTGKLNASVCLINTETSWFCEKVVRPCATVNSRIEGCHSFSVHTSQLNITDRRFSLLCNPKLALSAYVTDKNGGETEHGVELGAGVWEQRVKLTFLANNYFKPFFPYSAKVYASNADGSPAASEKILLTIGKLGITRSLNTDSQGVITFTIHNLTHNTDFFVLNAKTLDKEDVDTKLYTIFPASVNKHVKQWYSPSSSYIQLSSGQTSKASCGEMLPVSVVYSLLPDSSILTFMYQVISRGNIIESKDMMGLVDSSIAHKHSYTGLVFTPNLLKEGSDSKDSPFDINSPQGPIGGPIGPPGQPGMAGPPGSKTGNQQNAPVVPLTHVDLSHTSDNKTDSSDFESPGFANWKPPRLWKIGIQLNITEQMSPKLRLLVYLITERGEMVADTIHFNVDNCHKNKVSMSVKERSRRPGEKVSMSVSAVPGSLCAASMVDWRLLQLGGPSLLLPTHIDSKLAQFDLTSDFINDWQYCSDVSDMPPVLSAAGPYQEAGAPGHNEDSEIFSGRFRKKRSIMQFYSNMYDSLLAFKVAGVQAISDLDLQTRPCLHDGSHLGAPLVPGEPYGPIPGPYNLGLKPNDEPSDHHPPTSKFRRDFRNTWLWDLFEIPETGSVTVTPRLPDSITRWVGNSFCSSSEAGLGVSQVASVWSFQPFFMSIKLPYSVVRGELVHISVEVYNYLKHCIAVHVLLAKNGAFVMEGEREKEAQLCICADRSTTLTFKIRPHSLGKISLTFSALLKEHRISCQAAEAPPGYAKSQVTDMLVKTLQVEPEGVEQEHTKSFYICPKDSPNGLFQKQIEPEIAQSLLVNDSLSSWISVIGDIMGPVLGGLESLVQLPTGCGEQNMVRLAPNLATLEYLTATQQLSSDVEARTLDHLHKGYQQELKFMHKNGAFSAFGEADDHGSTWLSAFVFKTLRKASKFIFIDRQQIQTKTWQFLTAQQGENGCFNAEINLFKNKLGTSRTHNNVSTVNIWQFVTAQQENGKMLSKYMTGGVAGSQEHKKRALTAYVLVTMLESFKMMRERTPPFVSLAVKCIQADSLNDTYTLALTTYAMSLYKPSSHFTNVLMTRLKNKAIVEDDVMYWRRDELPQVLSGQGRAASAEVEITAYALLALLTKDKNIAISEVIPIVRWMTSQRNAYGGFSSTQDTVVALQALSVFAGRVYGAGLDVSVSIANGARVSMDFQVSQGNSIILQQQTVPLPEAPLHITAKGEGCVMLQVTSHYNIMNTVPSESDSFTLTVSSPVTMDVINNNCRTRTLRVCTSYMGSDNVSDMAIVEVKLTSGWIVDSNTLDTLLNLVGLDLKKYEMDNRHPDVVNFYFDQLDSKETCFDFNIVLEVEVENKQLAIARVFDYYDTDEQQTVFYKLSPCTEDQLEMDVSLLNSNLQLDKKDSVVIHKSTYHTGKSDKEKENPMFEETNVPSPDAPAACPHCVSTGTVNILQDICKKQVWKLEPVGLNVSIQIVTSDSVSPPLHVPMPPQLRDCDTCKTLLLQHGAISLAVLEATDWQKLGLNLAKADTVVIPWSQSVQVAMQHTLISC